jgi:hypothetical protein
MRDTDQSAIECAYAAGFIDGEGCVMIYMKPTGGVDYRIVTEQKDVRPLVRLQIAFGGQLYYNAKQARHIWVVRGELAVNLAKAIVEYTTLKKDQLELFISSYDPRDRNSRRTDDENLLLAIDTIRLAEMKKAYVMLADLPSDEDE